MNSTVIRAVSLDCWDTILVDDSDEPKRLAQGLLPKKEQRRKLVTDILASHEPISDTLVAVAYDTADAAFAHVWANQQVTWKVAERLKVLLAGLGRELSGEEFDQLVRLHEEMELQPRPELAPGIKTALQDLRGNYRLAILSDTVFSPGRVLRKILAEEGLFELFDVYVFSDELGRAKPHAAMFETAADLLGVKLNEIVHVGDREHNDILGPRRAGCRAFLTTVVKDRRDAPTQAEAVCDDYSKLAAMVDALANS